MLTRHIFQLIKVGVAALVTVTAILLISPASDKAIAALYSAIFWIEDSIHAEPLLGALSFVLLSALSAILTFASSIPLVPSAILVWGIPLTFFLLLGGWVIGAIFTYWIGTRFTRPVLLFFVSEEKLARYELLVSKEARFWMILLFCLAVPSEIPGFILGAMRYDFAKFISAVIIAEAVYALGSVLIAQNILDKEILSIGSMVMLLIVVVAVSALLVRMYRTKNTGK